ncbi:CHAT domain-containing protein [Geodermatophilus sp. URMC 62]|uniref:CHAT domain-containing protein n=1 Tax=Geodermatophilus sp. URMC 62 TaxID=3423414 RepID=UPI00406C0798
MTDWTSQLVDIIRPGADIGSLRTGEDYLIARGGDKLRAYRMPLTDENVLDCLENLRAAILGTGSEDERATKIVVETVTEILSQEPPAAPLQIDLVTSHREIAALPFEAALASDGKQLLVGRTPPVVLTRRIRGRFRERTPVWPATPRVLLIGSSPEQPIPLEEHLTALMTALRPWVEPLEGVPEAIPHAEKILTTLEGASLRRVAEACRVTETPFTHVHVLAHGCRIRSGKREQFGLQLFSDDGRSAVGVSGSQLADALAAGGVLPTVVTLTACDSANVGSTTVDGASIAHSIHQAGVPIVVAAQYPMSHAGSALTVGTFYAELLNGTDVRDALVLTREALYGRGAGRDWMSLVAYAQLPEGYQDRLLDVRLKADLASMETAGLWAEHLVRHDATREKYDYVIDQLSARIESLSRWEAEAERVSRRDMLEESRGLLGSANKRLAELHFRRGALEASRGALMSAAECYARAYDRDPSSYWTGVQELSLEAVTHGLLQEPWRWHAAMHAARADRKAWNLGSQAELHLLGPYAGQPRDLDAASAALDELTQLAADDPYPVTATARQLARYVTWWRNDNGFFPGTADLGADVEEILSRWNRYTSS